MAGPASGPRPVASGGELAGYLRDAAAVLSDPRLAGLRRGAVLGEPLERLRWFELPAVCPAGGVP